MFMQNTLRSLERGKIYPRKELISIMKNENSEMSDNSLICAPFVLSISSVRTFTAIDPHRPRSRRP